MGISGIFIPIYCHCSNEFNNLMLMTNYWDINDVWQKLPSLTHQLVLVFAFIYWNAQQELWHSYSAMCSSISLRWGVLNKIAGLSHGGNQLHSFMPFLWRQRKHGLEVLVSLNMGNPLLGLKLDVLILQCKHLREWSFMTCLEVEPKFFNPSLATTI